MRPFEMSGCAMAVLLATSCGAVVEPPGECIPGVWESPPLTCRTVCPGRTECDAGDCSLRDLEVLLQGGEAVSVRVSVSFLQKRLTAGPRTTTNWSVRGDEFSLGGSTAQSWSCDSSSLSVGLQTFARSDAAVSRAVLIATQSNEWDNVALE